MDSVAAIDASLDRLEEVLAPLLDTPLCDVTTDLLQSAKLQVLLPYIVNDLIFLYLRTRGVNPKHHAVLAELDRVKQYFEKIKRAEDPDKRKLMIDQQAATRFIRHAMRESRPVKRPQETGIEILSESVPLAAPSAAALAKIETRNEAEEEESSSDNGLDMYGESPGIQERETVGAKRRRGMDPWQGHSDSETPRPSGDAEQQPTSASVGAKKKKGNQPSDPSPSVQRQEPSTAVASEASTSQSKCKKRRKPKQGL